MHSEVRKDELYQPARQFESHAASRLVKFLLNRTYILAAADEIGIIVTNIIFGYPLRPALFAVWAVAMLSAAQAQSLIHFLPTARETQVATVTALANGEYFVNSTLGRLRLSSELTVRALNNDYAGNAVKHALLGEDRIEIDQPSRLFGFTGISTNFSFTSPAELNCAVRRFGADESVRWYQHVKGSSCTDMSVAENNEIWLTSNIDLLTLREDGTLKYRNVLPQNERSFITGVQAARGANLGGAFVRLAPHVPQFAAVAFIDASGVERWRVQTDAVTPSLRALADGGVEIAGRSVQTFNASGQRLSERQDDTILGSVVASSADANTGERWVLTSASECALTKLSSTGTTLWRTPLPCTVTLDRIRNFNTADSQRAAVLIGQNAIAVVGKNAIAVLTHAGAMLISQSVSGEGVSAVALNPGGTQLLYVASTAIGTEYKLRQLSLTTKLDQTVNLPASSGYSPLIAQETAPDGTTFAITYIDQDTPESLMAISTSGQLLWQVPVEFNSLYDNLVGASNHMVCITRAVRSESGSGESNLACWNSSSGQALFELKKPYGYFPNDSLGLDSRAASLFVYGDRVLIARASVTAGTFLGGLMLKNYEAISDTGAQLFAFDLPGGMTEHIWGERGLIATNDPSNSFNVQEALSYFVLHGNYVGFRDSDTLLSVWDQDGQLISSISYPYAQSELSGLAALSNGMIVGRREGTRVASSDPREIGLRLVPGTLFYEFFDFNGTFKWRQPAALYDTGFLEPELAQEIYPIIPANSRVELKEDRREARPMLYALRSYDAGDHGFAPRRAILQKIDLNTGALLWRRSVNVDPIVSGGSASKQAIELPTQQVNGEWQVLVRGRSVSGADFYDSLGATSGNSLDIQRIGDEFPQSATITAGHTRFILRQNPPLPRSPQPLGAPSQIGAWYNPATPGQGFFIERIGNTQFMAWFHSDWDLPDASVTDFLSPARQRWLTLQGDVLPGATQAQLKIYQTSGGSFTRESAGAPVEVGTATLTFLSCDSATFNYELSAQRCAGVACTAGQRAGMLHGVIPLRALLPASACSTPTSLPAPASAKTGLFHDPTVSGQGLITVVNANTLFAGWFTRDPADAADDPHKQAWFTLQASVSESSSANGAVIQAKIYRTLGGRRDSVLPVSSQEVGDATLSFPSCDRVTMQYRFAASDAVKPFQNLGGQLNLLRIGACR